MLISDQQVKKLWCYHDNGQSIRSASLKAGIHRKTGAKYIKQRILPSKQKKMRTWCTRQDPFIDDWDEIKEKLKKDTKIPTTVIFKELQRQRPGFYKNGQLRTLQRKLKAWRSKNNISSNPLSIKTDNFDYIFFMKCKKKIFQCMRNGKSYVDVILQVFFPNMNFDKNDLILTDNERQSVIESGKCGKRILWKVGVAIELHGLGADTRTISHLLDISKKTIRSKNKIYNEYGFEYLLKEYAVNPFKERTALKTKRILEILHQKPSLFGIKRSNWKCESIAKVYSEKYKENISSRTVGRLVNNAGYKMKKAKEVLTSPDPNYQEKVELLLKTIQSLSSNELFFFIDELGPLRVKKYGGRCYIKKEDVYRVPKIQISKGSVTLTAALGATTNQLSWSYGKAKDTSAMIDLIEILYNQYYNKSKIFITWDAASWHSSNELHEWLDKFNTTTRHIGKGPIIEFIPLPTSSQFLNVIESIFSGMKRAVIHHSDYQSQEEMKLAISTHFKERNEYFKKNPKRAGKKIWEIDFFLDYNNMKFGNYMKW